ncbi:hypothetical protein [uncultured Meiothermus sp.]|jgi:hypothetical protein|uniref:hypothetical protein n=1 Tax=uncultured Meiothermus sp. TaxID=157471 RepID=UPI00260DE3EB|nr:hypothetical protein [uncultured Meiothermus sp.]
MKELDVLMEFLEMPLGSADAVFDKFSQVPGALLHGEGLERFLFIKGERANKVVLVAHADTFWDEHYERSHAFEPKELEFKDGIIKNKKGGLGADDRAGCAMIWLLKEMGHSILITDGEEGGRKGSKWLMHENPDIAHRINSEHQFMIQLDRRGARDFKCYSVGTDKFRSYVGEITGYSEPDYSSYTDIVTLCSDICGVNLSIGYCEEHSENEHLKFQKWLNTLDRCRQWLSEPELPRFPRL